MHVGKVHIFTDDACAIAVGQFRPALNYDVSRHSKTMHKLFLKIMLRADFSDLYSTIPRDARARAVLPVLVLFTCPALFASLLTHDSK